MPEIEPFTKQMLERALKAGPWKYLTDSDGDFGVYFREETSLGSMSAYFVPAGSTQQLLRCYSLFDLEIPDAHLSSAIYLCNEYHVTHLFPSVYVYLKDGENSRTGRFFCQHTLDLECGIHQDGVLNFLKNFVTGAAAFEQWVVKQPQYWK